MPGLQDVAGEIKVLIAESLLSQDCFHFAFTDKHTWVLCKPLIERHRRLSEEYGIIVANFRKYTVWDTLDAVLADPRLAFYITEARLLADHCSILNIPHETIWDRRAERNERLCLHKSDPVAATRYTEASMKNPYLNVELAPDVRAKLAPYSVRYPMAFETWQQSTIECRSDLVLRPMFLHLLPNLRVLHYQTQPGEHEWMGNSLVRIADAYQGSNPEPGLPFDHL
ncbi:hypothetical protein BS50DRAFT_197420 [Corynespora cassiicola Philippines]|uniref:Uncharacterized protein n=1 Tax=Corynespora cassiicola Philippines TaxID=1448308 RepID=A0A2T2N5U2_CORCC|nr:hypothetical protein BS50DRAFT_197420 [Corynespora cassiicola Philippines]